MNISGRDFDFSRLNTAERILLAQELWDSIHAEADVAMPPVTDEQIAEIRRRVAAADAGEVTWRSWDEVKVRLRQAK